MTLKKSNEVPNIFDCWSNLNFSDDKYWLIVGKGPSFSKCNVIDFTQVYSISLNDSVRNLNGVSIAHFVDYEAFTRCWPYLDNADIVLLPRFPHFENRSGARSLSDLVLTDKYLCQLLRDGRLFQYDLSTASTVDSSKPIISATYFSAEAALGVLAEAGVRKIRTIGVDGGKSYSSYFSDLKAVSLLKNGQADFNRQFDIFPKLIRKYNLNFGPLKEQLPVRIFIAATASEFIPLKVLEYSIKKHASVSVEIIPLCDTGIQVPEPRDSANKARTPFSFQRFLIPEACGYTGKAIYLDSDMLVFKDIMSLWNLDFGDNDLLCVYENDDAGRVPQFSVLLLNCDRCKWSINSIIDDLNRKIMTYEDLLYKFTIAKFSAEIKPIWNSQESYSKGNTALLHYTDMCIQPWVSTANKLTYLWVKMLRQAISDGLLSRDFLVQEIEAGHVRPSLLYQVDNGIDEPMLLPEAELIKDKDFIPPYASISSYTASGWRKFVRIMKWKILSLDLRMICSPYLRNLKSFTAKK